MQARYFDVSSGRFLSGDPSGITVGEAFSFNRFVYANGNPISNADPTGKDCEASPGSAPCSPPPTPPVPPSKQPNPSEAAQLASIVVVATVTTSAVGTTSSALWGGGLVTLGVGLYLMDGNGFNELVTGNQGCYGDLSCQQPWLHRTIQRELSARRTRHARLPQSNGGARAGRALASRLQPRDTARQLGRPDARRIQAAK